MGEYTNIGLTVFVELFLSVTKNDKTKRKKFQLLAKIKLNRIEKIISKDINICKRITYLLMMN